MAMPTAKAAPSHIKDLRPDPENRRKHSPRNIAMIADALQEVGAARSIVIDENDEVLAGNGVLEAAAEVGITKVRIVDAPGDEVIAVRRKNLSAEQKRKLAMFDNRASELAEWDADQLQRDLDAGHDLSPFFTDKEIKALVDEAGPVRPMAVPRPTEVVWVLLAIPLGVWPRHQAAAEAMQEDAEMTALVVRPAQDDDPFRQPQAQAQDDGHLSHQNG
jgi:hypothetical protein